MDSYNFDFLMEPKYSENDEIKRIKQMLISENKEQIICAASEILSGMEDNKRMVDMIKSDVCGFLCNAMVPFESNISGAIYNCLALMAKSKYFYIHGHASVAIETVTRSMHFLIKSVSHDFRIRQPLKLLELIVEGYAEYHIQPEKKPLINLMALILNLLKENVTQGVKYQIGVIIRGMFNREFLIVSKELIVISEKWVDASFFKRSEPLTLSKDFINLGCAISKEALSCLTSNSLSELESDLEIESEGNIAKTVTIFLLEYASSYVVVEENEVEMEGIERLENYFMCLCFLLKDLFEQQQLIVNTLSEMGFIQRIYRILSDKYLNMFENLCKVCSTVLLEILLALSDDVFNFDRMWPDGRDNFRNEITNGMYPLPFDASLWRDSTTDVALNRSGKLFLIIFFYFHFLTIKSSSNEIVIMYPSVINLVNTMLEKTSSPLQIKAVWFIFVMTQMSETWTRDISAVEKMLDILQVQTELTLVYTHHPAMLFWAFSTPGISYRIQCEIFRVNRLVKYQKRFKFGIKCLLSFARVVLTQQWLPNICDVYLSALDVLFFYLGPIVLILIDLYKLEPLVIMKNDVLRAEAEAIQKVRRLRKRQTFLSNLCRPSKSKCKRMAIERNVLWIKSPFDVPFGRSVTPWKNSKMEYFYFLVQSAFLKGDFSFRESFWKFLSYSVKLWLQNSSGDSSILDNLVQKSEDARLALFELLKNGDEYTSRMAFSTLKTFMLSSEDYDSHSGSVWLLLLQTLAKFTADSSNVSAVEVDYILELATLRAPEPQHLSESVRIASLLPEALKKTSLISLTTAMKLVLQLLEMSFKCDDSRVLSAFLRSGGFIQKILSALETNMGELLFYNLKITTILWSRPPSSMLLLPDYDGIMMDTSVLLKIINSKDKEIINSGLVLIEKMLSDRFKSYLIRVRVSSDFMEILFFDLENALIMYGPLISGLAWSCLKHCIKENDSLAQDVLLNEVIKHGLENLEKTPEMVDFLLIWMERRRETDKFYSGYRRMKPSYFLETIYEIASFLSETRPGNAEPLCDGVLKCCRHFSIDTSIEPFSSIATAASDVGEFISGV